MEFLCNFDVRQILGRGSYSEVKRCIDKRTKTDYAVKEVVCNTRRDERMISNEIEILQSLDHYNIIRLHYIFHGQQSFYLVMEYASGGDLLNDIVKRSLYSEKTGREIIRQVLDAVMFLHEHRIVHRNIKPEKLLLAWQSVGDHPYPPVKLAGFGMAKRLAGNSNTIQCEMEGSPLYLAPETISSKDIGTAVDIWACGVVLYILVAGYPPFWSTERSRLFEEITSGHLLFADSEWKTVSPQVKHLIGKMLTTDPHERITAQQALQEPWLTNDNISTSHRRNTLEHLNVFNAKRKLKGVVFGVLAMKRLSECASP